MGATDLPQTIGPYRILEVLGRGGMGVVYRAEHQDTGRPAAVKTVRVPRRGLLQSIRREIHSLAALRHPGIICILEHGVDDVPWYAMELMQGMTLAWLVSRFRRMHSDVLTAPSQRWSTRDWAADRTRTAGPSPSPERWWTESLSDVTSSDAPLDQTESVAPRISSRKGAPAEALPEVLTLVRQLCDTLAFLHGEGIVHRDLKPANVLLRDDWRPVIVDFGLVSRFSGQESREELEDPGSVSGTVAYMSPEQVRGQLVDARADLYALGCILYELLTGRPPFVSPHASEVLAAHLHSEPEPPSSWAPHISAQLDSLVMRLLAKEPEQRIGHADTVALALEGLGAKAIHDSAAPSDDSPKPRAYLYRPQFAGRKGPLERLAQCLWRLDAGTGGLALVGGESGVGKTRLIVEFGRSAVQREMLVLPGQCQPIAPGATEGSGRPLEALLRPLQAVGDRCRELGHAETERLLGSRGLLLSAYEPTLLGLPGQDRFPDPPELPPDAAKQRLFGALAQTLAALAEARPVVLVLDDLQWADELTLGFFEHLLGAWYGPDAERSVQVLLVGAYRSEEAGTTSGAPLLRLIGLAEAAGQHVVRLGPLDDEAVTDMCSGMLALTPAPPVLIQFLTREAEGNPFFVAEYLRTAVVEGVLWRDEQGRWRTLQSGPEQADSGYDALPLPRSLQQLVSRRLDGLSPSATTALQAAAVLGREFGETLLAQTATLEETRLMDCIRELLTRQVLEPGDAGGLHFVHDKFRDAAYQRIPAEPRRRLHHSAATAIDALPRDAKRGQLGTIGYHWEQAGENALARRAYAEAAQVAAAQGAVAEAERLFRAEQSLIEVPDEDSLDGLMRLSFRVLHLQGRNKEARKLASQALEQSRAFGLKNAEGRSLKGLGVLAWLTGEAAEACRLLEAAAQIFRELGDQGSEGDVINTLASVLTHQGKTTEARRLYDRAIELADGTGKLLYAALAMCNLGILSLEEGDWSESLLMLERAGTQFRGLGQDRYLASVLQHLGWIQFNQGSVQDALESYNEALRIQRDQGDRRNEMYSLYSIGQIEMALGRHDAARGLFEQALDFGHRAGEVDDCALLLRNLAQLDLAAGLPAQARAKLAEALDLLGESSTSHVRVSPLLMDLCRIERLVGDASLDPCRRLLRRAGVAVKRAGASVANELTLACTRGHLALASNRSSIRWLRAAHGVASRLRLRMPGPMAQEVERLDRAQEAFVSGQPLWRGERVEDLPAGLCQWLCDEGMLPSAASH